MFFRAERRAKLKLPGEFLAETKPTASNRVQAGRLSPSTKAALTNIAKLAGIGARQIFTTFAVKNAPARKGRGVKTATAPSRYHISIGTPGRERSSKINRGVALVAKEVAGRIVAYRIYHQR